jgi:hypothetical protein
MFGLSFANPLLLHGLWAALLPVVIHLLNRRRTVTVPFSNVALLQALQLDRMRRIKLKQILLLILRAMLIILLVLAFARPTLRGASGQVGDAGTSAVILLDHSLSMQHRTPEGTLYDRAVQRVRALLTLFNDRDDVRLLLVDSSTEETEVPSLERLRLHLDALCPGFGSTDFEAGLKEVLSHLSQSRMPNRELYFVTDLAYNGWVNLPDTLANLEGVSVCVIVERPKSVANLGITQVKTVGGSPHVGRPITLEIELINYGSTNRGDVPVQAFLNDRRITQQIAHVPAKGRRKLHTRFVPETSGAVSLRVEIGEDDLDADNRRVTVLSIPKQVRVLLVADVPDEAYYLAQALPVASYEVIQVRPDEIAEQVLEGIDAVFLCNVERLSSGTIAALQSRVSRGLGLGIFLGDQIDIRHYNERLLPALFPATLQGVRGSAGGAYQALQADLPDHPMLADIELEGSFQSPRFYLYYRIQPKKTARPVLSFASGAPALLESRGAGGHVAVFASSVSADLVWNDVPLSGFFLPFVHRLTGYLAAGAFGRSDYQVGQVVFRDIRDGKSREAVLRPPGQEPVTIWPEQRGLQSVWPVGEVNAPGVWEIFAHEQLADRFAVQIDIREPDLTPVSKARLEALFGRERLLVIDGGTDLRETILSRRHGQELWRSVLMGALFVMAAEMLIARSTRTSRAEGREGERLSA